jgi:hypothetical protein
VEGGSSVLAVRRALLVNGGVAVTARDLLRLDASSGTTMSTLAAGRYDEEETVDTP